MSEPHEIASRILYEDNHYLFLNKAIGELTQGDKKGDISLLDTLKAFIKSRDHKPGNVFLQPVHRIDRPVSGVIMFAKTSKGVTRAHELFRERIVKRLYWAITEEQPPELEGVLEHHLHRNQQQNKSYLCSASRKGAQEAKLHYRMILASRNYYLLEIMLDTGRHHQIRAQLSGVGCPVRGDLKYGAKRSLKEGGIGLHARSLDLIHPVSGEPLFVQADPPREDSLWKLFLEQANATKK